MSGLLISDLLAVRREGLSAGFFALSTIQKRVNQYAMDLFQKGLREHEALSHVKAISERNLSLSYISLAVSNIMKRRAL